MKTETTIERKYYVTIGQLRKALGLKGDFVSSNMYSGLSPNETERGISRDREVIEIVTREKQPHGSDSRRTA